jgi:hypothetical protein
MKSCLEPLTLGEMHSNGHNNIHNNFQELIQIQQEHLKVLQEKQQPTFQLVMDREVYR